MWGSGDILYRVSVLAYWRVRVSGCCHRRRKHVRFTSFSGSAVVVMICGPSTRDNWQGVVLRCWRI